MVTGLLCSHFGNSVWCTQQHVDLSNFFSLCNSLISKRKSHEIFFLSVILWFLRESLTRFFSLSIVIKILFLVLITLKRLQYISIVFWLNSKLTPWWTHPQWLGVITPLWDGCQQCMNHQGMMTPWWWIHTEELWLPSSATIGESF